MKLKYLAISDTHLGEPNSVLSFPRGIQHLWFSLRHYFGEENIDDPLEVDEVILIGDIPDRTLSSTAEIETHTGNLVQSLLSALNFKKLVYVIGNHDHTLWTNYVEKKNHGSQSWQVTPCVGERITSSSRMRTQPPEADELLGLFFNYPWGSAWNRVIDIWTKKGSFDFLAANPMYAQEFQGRLYVFAHGTHFRSDVCWPHEFKTILEDTKLLNLVNLHIKAGMDIGKARDLNDLEHRIWDFVDSLWPSARNNPSPLPDRVWFLRRSLRIGLDPARATPETTKLVAWDKLSEHQDRIVPIMDLDALRKGKLALNSNSVERWHKFFVPHMLRYINKEFPLAPVKAITFVFGDDHLGGWGHLGINRSDLSLVPFQSVSGNIIDARIVNTGAWIVESKDRHPPCHIFAVDESGSEYILDISYKGVETGGEPLLDLAEKEYEQRESRVGSSVVKNIKSTARKWFSRIKSLI